MSQMNGATVMIPFRTEERGGSKMQVMLEKMKTSKL